MRYTAFFAGGIVGPDITTFTVADIAIAGESFQVATVTLIEFSVADISLAAGAFTITEVALSDKGFFLF